MALSSIGENCNNISFFPRTAPFIYFFLIFSLLSGWQVSGGFFLRLTSLWVCVRLTKDPTKKQVEIAFSFSLWAKQFPPGCPALPTRWENRIYKYRMEACRDWEKSRDECELKCIWVGQSAHAGMYSENISVCRIFPILTYFPGHTPLFCECEMTSGMFLKLSVPSSWVNTPCIHHHSLLLVRPSLCWFITRGHEPSISYKQLLEEISMRSLKDTGSKLIWSKCDLSFYLWDSGLYLEKPQCWQTGTDRSRF